MTAQLTEAELEVIWAAAAALPPPQRAAFQERVAAELNSLPCGMIGPGSLHRVIAACQKIILDAGAVAVGPTSLTRSGPGPSERHDPPRPAGVNIDALAKGKG
jgi:hypothetical protein